MLTARKETNSIQDDDDGDKGRAVYKVAWNIGQISSTLPGKGKETEQSRCHLRCI